MQVQSDGRFGKNYRNFTTIPKVGASIEIRFMV